jgi:N-acetylglucosamine transport system substrate-binding protein
MDALNAITSYQEGAWTNPDVVAVLENIAKLGDNLMENTLALDHTQTQSAMMLDEALFIPNGDWIEGEMKDADRSEGFYFALTPAPVMEAGDTRYVMTSVEQWSIPSSAANPELAKEFLRFLYTEEAAQVFAEVANGTLAINGIAEVVKDNLTPDSYGMRAVYGQDNVVSMFFGWTPVPEGSMVLMNDEEVFKPMNEVMAGNLSVEQWVSDLEAASAQIRADQEAAG